MESASSASSEPQVTCENAETPISDPSEKWFTDRFESLLPIIQERWPDIAHQTIEATKGSLDEMVRVISQHSGKTANTAREQLEELFDSAGEKTKDIAESLEPLEKQLEELLDDLNKTLRPRIEKPVRERPLLAIGVATSIGVIIGIILAGGKRS